MVMFTELVVMFTKLVVVFATEFVVFLSELFFVVRIVVEFVIIIEFLLVFVSTRKHFD